MTIDRVKELIRQAILYSTTMIDLPGNTGNVKSIMHAVALALGLSKTHGRGIIVTVLDPTWTGIAVYANNITSPEVHVCSLQLGIPYECDKESVIQLWPAGNYTVKASLI